jgi:beta-hydroxylase
LTSPTVRAAGAAVPEAPGAGRSGREHLLDQRATRLGRAALAVQGAVERLVARVSIHGDPAVYDPALFPWIVEIEAEWTKIRAELDRVLVLRDRMPAFHEIIDEVRTITTDQDWKTFWLASIGMDCEKNRRRCPETTRLLGKVPGLKTAFFSILSPHKHIPAHRGAYNGLLRYHLGLIVPEPRAECRIRIADQVCHWSEGKSLVFDDTFNHEVWNDTEGTRVVLFVDFARPLRAPFHGLNLALLALSALAPFLRRARRRHKLWERRIAAPP